VTTLDPAATTVVDHTTLRTHLERMLGALGVPPDQAPVITDNLVEADLRGSTPRLHLMALYFGRVCGHLRPDTKVKTAPPRADGAARRRARLRAIAGGGGRPAVEGPRAASPPCRSAS
jgi:hypothetical protein